MAPVLDDNDQSGPGCDASDALQAEFDVGRVAVLVPVPRVGRDRCVRLGDHLAGDDAGRVGAVAEGVL
jgi:hypothetical protein